MYVIIIAGSLPTLRPLVQQGLVKSRSLANNKKRYRSYPDDPNPAHPLQRFANIYDTIGNQKHPKEQQRDIGVSSDQSILEPRIEKTTYIRVSYDEDPIKPQVSECEPSDVSKEPIHAVERV